MAKDKAINDFTYDNKSYERKSSTEEKTGLSKREQHNFAKLDKIDFREAKREESNKAFYKKMQDRRAAKEK